MKGQTMGEEREYLDFTLELRDLDLRTDTFKVAVLPSSAVGETQQAITVSYRYGELEYGLDDLDRKQISPEDLISLGEQLTSRLLPTGPIRNLFMDALKRAGLDGGVRLRLLIRHPKLAQLPWEFSYLQLHGGGNDRRHFLVLNPQISMVRHEALPEEHRSLAGATPNQLRLVAATANVDGFRPLKLDLEKQVIEKALRGFEVDGVTIEWEPFIEDATDSDLSKALRKGADLFHFAGHGTFSEDDVDPETGESIGTGYIVLKQDRESGRPLFLPAADLALRLQQAGVRVAVLGACKSGRRDGLTAWTGVASALIERGIPAVVAMQYEVLDTHALAFSEAFYASLAGGLSVDEGLSAGRLAMLGQSSERDVEWGVPVLYMRSTDGLLFPKLKRRPSQAATELRHVIRQTIRSIKEGGKVVGVKNEHGSFVLQQEVDEVNGTLIGWEGDQ
jgi:hypothetical protein